MLSIIRGIPGSGKSTFARTLQFSGHVHIEADMYFIKNGKYTYNPNLIGLAHKWCQNSVENELKRQNSVVVSNTFTTEKEIRPYIELAKKYKVPYKIFKMVSEYKSIHNVPIKTITKMKNRFCDIENEICIYNSSIF